MLFLFHVAQHHHHHGFGRSIISCHHHPNCYGGFGLRTKVDGIWSSMDFGIWISVRALWDGGLAAMAVEGAVMAT